MNDPLITTGRACGTCTLCCKVPEIRPLGKPHDQWCEHCDIGRGCRIYDHRPAVCRGFYCDYLLHPMVGEHWFPARSNMILFTEQDGSRLTIFVDAAHSNAWREQPYYDEIKRWATYAARDMRQVLVWVDGRSIAILPDEDVDLGMVADDERIVMSEFMDRGRLRIRVTKMRNDDPRLAAAPAGGVSNPAPDNSLSR